MDQRGPKLSQLSCSQLTGAIFGSLVGAGASYWLGIATASNSIETFEAQTWGVLFLAGYFTIGMVVGVIAILLVSRKSRAESRSADWGHVFLPGFVGSILGLALFWIILFTVGKLSN